MNALWGVDVYAINFIDWFLIFQDFLCVLAKINARISSSGLLDSGSEVILASHIYLLHYAIVKQHINRRINTTGYILLYVSAVTRTSSGQQGIVLIKVYSLIFSNGV